MNDIQEMFKKLRKVQERKQAQLPKYSEKDLLYMVLDICLAHDIKPIPTTVRYNNLLQSSVGRIVKDGIEIRKSFTEQSDKETIIKVLKHLCTHILYPVHNEEFYNFCTSIGGELHIAEDTNHQHISGKVYVYQCPRCKREIIRKKKYTSPKKCRDCTRAKYKKYYDSEVTLQFMEVRYNE